MEEPSWGSLDRHHSLRKRDAGCPESSRGVNLGEDLPAQRQIARLMAVRDSMRREIGSQQKYLEA